MPAPTRHRACSPLEQVEDFHNAAKSYVPIVDDLCAATARFGQDDLTYDKTDKTQFLLHQFVNTNKCVASPCSETSDRGAAQVPIERLGLHRAPGPHPRSRPLPRRVRLPSARHVPR